MPDSQTTEGYSLAEAAGIDVLVSPDGTVRPASDAELWMWRQIVRMRALAAPPAMASIQDWSVSRLSGGGFAVWIVLNDDAEARAWGEWLAGRVEDMTDDL